MNRRNLCDQEFSESIYNYLEEQRSNHLNFLQVLCGKTSIDEALEVLGAEKEEESAA